MADRYNSLTGGKEVNKEATDTSTGVGEAGDIVALDAGGKLDVSLFPTGMGPDVLVAPAFEDLDAGDYINVFDNGGTTTLRKADNSNGRNADGFVKVAVTAPANGTMFYEGANDAVSGKTIGARQYLSTAGDSTETPVDPAVDSGTIHQFLGKAESATSVNTDIADCVDID